MGALPKNKITSVERGKRRAGNTPSLKKDKNASIPLHKRGLVAQILKKAGIIKAGADADRATKRASKADRRAARGVAVDSKAVQKSASASVKNKTRTTQHKG